MTDPVAESIERRNARRVRHDELAFVRDARVGRLATVNARHAPVVVPICFAIVGDNDPVIVSVLDEKPKRVADERLGRIRNIQDNPAVCLVVDRYDEDWSKLAFVQVHGRAHLLLPDEDGHAQAIAALRARYPQYGEMAIDERVVIAIAELCAFSWRGDGTRFA